MIRLSSQATNVVIVLLIFISQHVAGQQGAVPYGLNYKIYKSIPEKRFQTPDTALRSKQYHDSQKISSGRVGHNFKTNFVPSMDGNWKTIFHGVDSWFLKLRSDGAYGLAVVFSDVKLQPGETLYVYNQHGLRGPYTHHNIPRSGILPLDFLPGEELMIEYSVPAGNNSHGSFVVESVSHAYQNITNRNPSSKKDAAARYDDWCYFCLEDNAISNERRAVVKLVIHDENSTRFCTGTLMNNTANDNTPLILTAEHCVSSQYVADRTVFIFGFEDENCVKQVNHDLMLNGAIYRASLFENDFTIMELYDKPPLEFHPYYAGWDISDRYLTGVTSIHHPQGGVRRVSVSNGTVRTSTLKDGPVRARDAFWNVIRWDAGVTDAGSSGASLLNKNSHVIGTLSGGSSRCGAPYNDYFEKLSASWEASLAPNEQLKHWLDPVGTGVQTLEGRDPFEGIQVDCNMVSNVRPGEQQMLLTYTRGSGFFSGFNSDGLASYAEKFSVADSAMLTGVMLNVGSVNKESPGGLLVSVHNNIDGVPGPPLLNSFVPYYRLRNDSLNYVGFYPYVELFGDFFISYTLSYAPQDSFALKQTNWRNDHYNTAFVKLPSGWTSLNTISPNGAGASLGINIALCENDVIASPPQTNSVSLYPNPTTTALIIKLPEDVATELTLEVYDLQGRQHHIAFTVYENSVAITTIDLAPGMYIARLSTSHGFYQFKFVKH
ncbi:MAG TPA: T9SS type A sorting domain-containing protein [Ohtaekwangia sp.]|nr:T9SS type A sorting domain-containing protein [Ohtaekwangia sp.]